MNNEEYEVFLNRTLNLVENAINFLKNDKHILSHNKILGIHQKLELVKEEKEELSSEAFRSKVSSQYLIDGQYDRAKEVIGEMKINLYKIYGRVKKENEKNKNEII